MGQKSQMTVLLLGPPSRAGAQPGPLQLVGFAPTEGDCSTLPGAQGEWCPAVVQVTASGDEEALQVGSRGGMKTGMSVAGWGAREEVSL